MTEIVNFRLADETRWTSAARCAEPDAPYMFPSPMDRDGIAEAKAACGQCPVRTECLTESLERREFAGVWGGLTEDERSTLVRRAYARKDRRQGRLSVDDLVSIAEADRAREQEAADACKSLASGGDDGE